MTREICGGRVLRVVPLVGVRGFAAIFMLMAIPFMTAMAPLVAAEEDGQGRLPHFGSLKASQVEVREGPGSSQKILWTYRKIGLPVEIIGVKGKWRLVRDSGGARGWVYHSMISALRMALTRPAAAKGTIIAMRSNPGPGAAVIARLEPGVLLLLKSCNGQWCHVATSGFDGWIEQKRLWGAYSGEIFK